MSSSPVVDVKKVTTAVLRYAVRLTPYAASSGVKLTCVFTPLDGSAGVITAVKTFYNIDYRVYGRKLRP